MEIFWMLELPALGGTTSSELIANHLNAMLLFLKKSRHLKFSVRTIFGDDKFRSEKCSVALLHENYFTQKFFVSNVPDSCKIYQFPYV